MKFLPRPALPFAFVAAGLATLAGIPAVAAPTKIACLGEQTTHSFHRENDPEYPQFLGERLDADFRVDATRPHPNAGGIMYGGGTKYQIGNFGHPRGSVLDHALDNPRSVLRSDELKLAAQFAPDIVILGPFGDHESQTHVSMDHFKADLENLVARINAFPHQPVLWLALPLPRGGEDGDENYRRILAETEKVAREKHLPVIDLWTAFLGRKEYFKDATHLTVPGRQHLAEVVANVITAGGAGEAPGLKPKP